MSKDTKKELYDGIEAMATVEITKLGELLQKKKEAETNASKNYYDKKIEKIKNNCIKYLLELSSIDPERAKQRLDFLNDGRNDENNENNESKKVENDQ